MRITLGKKYKNKFGQTVEATQVYADGIWCWEMTNIENGQTYGVTASGRYWGDDDPSGYDLDEEIYPEPNRTPIDQVSFQQLKDGVAKLWDIGRIW